MAEDDEGRIIMVIDIDYIKQMLVYFSENDKAYMRFVQLYEKLKLYENCDEKYIFHYYLLCDDSLIDSFSQNVSPYSAVKLVSNGNYVFGDLPLRMTKNGVDFLEALKNEEVVGKLKSLGATSLSVVKQIAISLFTEIIKNKAGL